MTESMSFDRFMLSLYEDEKCSICLEPYSSDNGHVSVRLACGHWFGRPCLKRYIEPVGSEPSPSGRCPLCRTVMYGASDKQSTSFFAIPQIGTGAPMRTVLVSPDNLKINDLWFLVCHSQFASWYTIAAIWRVVGRHLASDATLGAQSRDENGISGEKWKLIALDIARELPNGGGRFVRKLKANIEQAPEMHGGDILRRYVNIMFKHVSGDLSHSEITPWTNSMGEIHPSIFVAAWKVAGLELESERYEFSLNIIYQDRDLHV